MMKIYIEAFGGNLHSASEHINRLGWAEYLVNMTFTGNYTMCIFCMPAQMVKKLRKDSPHFVGNPDYDDPSPFGRHGGEKS